MELKHCRDQCIQEIHRRNLQKLHKGRRQEVISQQRREVPSDSHHQFSKCVLLFEALVTDLIESSTKFPAEKLQDCIVILNNEFLGLSAKEREVAADKSLVVILEKHALLFEQSLWLESQPLQGEFTVFLISLFSLPSLDYRRVINSSMVIKALLYQLWSESPSLIADVALKDHLGYWQSLRLLRRLGRHLDHGGHCRDH